MEYSLYEWQEECIKIWVENGYSGIVKVITGAGKTVMALAAVKELRRREKSPVRIHIVVPTIALAYQWRKSVINFFPKLQDNYNAVDIYGGSNKPKGNALFSIYVVNTARHRISSNILNDQKKGCFCMLIADECHHYVSKENSKIFHFRQSEEFDKKRYASIGLSATPETYDMDKILIPALGRIIYELGYREAVKQDIIADYFLCQTSVSFSAEELQEYRELTDTISLLFAKIMSKHKNLSGKRKNEFYRFLKKEAADNPGGIEEKFLLLSYKRMEITVLADERIECTLRIVKEYHGRKIIVFSERIAQVEKLKEYLSTIYPFDVECYHSEMDVQSKMRALYRFRTGEALILLTCKALDEGLDVPDTEIGIVLSGTSVERQRIQRLGRVLRKNNGEKSILYYLYIKESAEDSAYLEGTQGEQNILNLKYESNFGGFSNYEYERICNEILEKEERKGTENAVLSELRRCLIKGEMHPDWLLDEAEILKKAKNSAETAERNYWIAMLRVHQEESENKRTDKQQEQKYTVFV